MYRTTNFQPLNSFPNQSRYSNSNLMHLGAIDIKDPNLKLLVTNVLQMNEELTQKLNVEKAKNFDLLQLKRRMEEDMNKLEFEIDRIRNYENLSSRENQIKKNQVMQDNGKLQMQLDEYFEENKKIRTQLRKWMNQCEQLVRNKTDLVNQNVSLRKTVQDLQKDIQNLEAQTHEQKSTGRRINSQYEYNSLRNLPSLRSINEGGVNSIVLHSPHSPNSFKPVLENRSPKNADFFRKQELSTNPSEGKISFCSPIAEKLSFRNAHQTQKIYEDFYQQHADPSPRSFSNHRIKQNLQFFSPPKFDINQHDNNSWTKNSPSVFNYANRESPLVQPLKFHNNQGENNRNVEISQRMKTLQKKQLKDEVSCLRDQIIGDLVNGYYKTSLDLAEKQKSNSLKIFMQKLTPNLQTLDHMVKNYLEARAMLAESCPTLRLKWQPMNPLTNGSVFLDSQTTQSQLILKNTLSVSNIFESTKKNAKRQKTVAGQCLALFRFLTLLSKVQEVEPFLIECLKHSALKQIHRIQVCASGQYLTIDQQ